MTITRNTTKYPGIFYIISKEDDKIYYIRYYRGTKRIEEKVGRGSYGMTAAKANIIKTQRIQGKALSNQEKRDEQERKKQEKDAIWTINRLWERYLSTHRTKSIDICKARFGKHVAPVFGDKEPKDIIQLDITDFKSDLEKKGLKPGSVRKVMELLRRVINFGKNNQLISDIDYKIKLEKVKDQKTEYLTDEQFQMLWHAIETDHNRDAANFMKMVIFTGMRRGELFKLQKSHVNWQTRFISIYDPKGEESEEIPMNDLASDILKEQAEIYPESDYFFPGLNGKRRTTNKRGVNRIKQRAGLPKDFRPLHGLRHSFASLLASSGKVDIYSIQKLLTHKDPKMTQRYAHLVDEALKRGASTNEELLKDLIKKSKSK
jgi:integrase